MYKKRFLFLIFVCMISVSYGQKSKKRLFTPSKIGFHYNYGNEKNFLFDDSDYSYFSHTFKAQFFYPLTSFFHGLQLELLMQPQFQLIKHQLLNPQFVTPDIPNYLEKRAEYTKSKNISLYAIEFGVELKKEIFKHGTIFLQIGVGLGYINTVTERLAKGFTFIENGNLGIRFKINSHLSMGIHSGLGHVSNFNFQLPNSGYNILNSGVSFQYYFN